MKPLCGLALLLSSVLVVSAQVTLTDTFSGVSGLWEADVTASGGNYSVSGGVLNFTNGTVTTGSTASAQRDWTESLSASGDWTARVDLTTGGTLVGGQIITWTFYAAALGLNDYVSAQLVLSYMQYPNRTVLSTPYVDNVAGTADQASTTQGMVTFLYSFNAATSVLSLSYDADGNTAADNFTLLSTVNTGSAWGVTSSTQFGLRLVASNVANGMPGDALTSGVVYADNFSTTSAVPEPSTYAAIFGSLALLTALWRRRAINNATMR